MLKACVCCLWCLEKCLAYLNQVSVFGSVKWKRTIETEAKRSPAAALFSERLHRNRNQQHQLLHLGTRRFHHPGGERAASDRHQHSGGLCPLSGEGTASTLSSRSCQPGPDGTSPVTLMFVASGARRLLHGVLRRSGPQLPEALHRLGAAAPHRVRLCLPGGALLPVGLRERGGRPLPLLRHRFQVQRWQSGTRVLHGQGLDGETLALAALWWLQVQAAVFLVFYVLKLIIT